METWSVRARNLPEHAANPIHTDAGGRAAGFDGALVAGVTVYAYLTRPGVAAWGVDWLSRGLAEIEFTSPVLDDDPVDCVPETVDGGVEVRAMVGGDSRARLVAMPVADDDGPSTRPLHQPLEPQVEALVGEVGGLRAPRRGRPRALRRGRHRPPRRLARPRELGREAEPRGRTLGPHPKPDPPPRHGPGRGHSVGRSRRGGPVRDAQRFAGRARHPDQRRR